MTAFCAHRGCIHQLARDNTSGVCRDHMHGPACRCLICPRPARPKRRRPPASGFRTRPQTSPRPPGDDEPPLPIPVPA